MNQRAAHRPSALIEEIGAAYRALDEDLQGRAKDPLVDADFERQWQAATAALRCGAGLADWKRQRCSEIAGAWVVSTVVARILRQVGWLGGARADDGTRGAREPCPFRAAADPKSAQELLAQLRALSSSPATNAIFGLHENPLWRLGPGEERAHDLVALMNRLDPTELAPLIDGAGCPKPESPRIGTGAAEVAPGGWTDPARLDPWLDSILEAVRPERRQVDPCAEIPSVGRRMIVEATLERAIERFGLDGIRLIDPVCGAGDYLIAGFRCLFRAWRARAPSEGAAELARRALGSIHGTDTDPCAVLVTRFRLTVEACAASGLGVRELAAPLRPQVHVTDSLLVGRRLEQMRFSELAHGMERPGWIREERKLWGDRPFLLAGEEEAHALLGQRYHVVVGSPPDLPEPDPGRREAIRELYDSARGRFMLTAPFVERFFDLAVRDGFVGMSLGRRFTDRQFGLALIERVLPRLNVTHIVDAPISADSPLDPCRLLLFGRRRAPTREPIQLVLGNRWGHQSSGRELEHETWRDITAHKLGAGQIGRGVTVTELRPEALWSHPWRFKEWSAF